MCYNCDGISCNACGKYDNELFQLSSEPKIACLYCGSTVDDETRICTSCGKLAFALPGQRPK